MCLNNIIKINWRWTFNYFQRGMIFCFSVKFKNNFTKRKAELDMLKIERASSEATAKDFLTFIDRLEKYCKEIMPISDSKYQIALRMTK